MGGVALEKTQSLSFLKGSQVDWTSELMYKWEAAMLHPMWSDGTVTSGSE